MDMGLLGSACQETREDQRERENMYVCTHICKYTCVNMCMYVCTV